MNKSIVEVSRQIFGNLPHSNFRTGNKVLRKHSIGLKVASYYPQANVPDALTMAEKAIPELIVFESKEWKELKREEMKFKGKVKTKKGEGKRASRK